MTKTIHTFCRICEMRCGLAVTVQDNKVLRVGPDKQNPHTWHDFCVKARTTPEFIEHPRRFTVPMRRVGDSYVESTWEQAVADIAMRLRRILDEDGPDAVGMFTGNPAYFSGTGPIIAGGFMDAMGSTSKYNDGSLDHNAKFVVANGMFGSDLIMTVGDVDEADYFILVGANPVDSGFFWGGAIPQGWKRLLARRAQGAKLVVVDPRRTPTADAADLHIAIRPSTDWAFLLGLLKVILDEGLEHEADATEAVGLGDLRALVRRCDLRDLSMRCDVPTEQILLVAREFATARTGYIDAHTGVSISRHATLGEWLTQVLNVVTGRLDRPGGRRFEPGYVDLVKLAGALVPPMDGVSRVRGLPAVGGAHTAAEIPDEIRTPGHGRLRAMFLNAANPVVNGPASDELDDALGKLDLLVALDLVQRESHRHAHWLLPMPHFLEREDLMLFASGMEERPYVQFGPKAIDPPPGVREEFDFFLDLALAMKVPMFGKRGVNTVVRASRALARWTRRPGMAFNPRWIYRGLLRYGRTITWKQVLAHEHGWLYRERTFDHLRPMLPTPGKRIRLAPVHFLELARATLAGADHLPPEGFPLALISRRHSSTMNSLVNDLPTIHRRMPANSLEMHPSDAEARNLRDGSECRMYSPAGEVTLRVVVSEHPRPGTVICEHGWGSRTFHPQSAGTDPLIFGANRNKVVRNDVIDPISQVPALNGTWVQVSSVPQN